MATILRFRPRKRRAAKRGTPEGQPSLFEGFPYIPKADLHMRPADGSDARAVPMPSDAAPVDPLEPPEDASPEMVRRYRIRRWIFRVAMGAIFLSVLGWAIYGERGWVDLQRRQEELERLRAEVAVQATTVEGLRRQVADLRSDPKAVERIAREELGYALPGEISLLLPRAPEVDRRGGSATVRASKSEP